MKRTEIKEVGSNHPHDCAELERLHHNHWKVLSFLSAALLLAEGEGWDQLALLVHGHEALRTPQLPRAKGAQEGGEEGSSP